MMSKRSLATHRPRWTWLSPKSILRNRVERSALRISNPVCANTWKKESSSRTMDLSMWNELSQAKPAKVSFYVWTSKPMITTRAPRVWSARRREPSWIVFRHVWRFAKAHFLNFLISLCWLTIRIIQSLNRWARRKPNLKSYMISTSCSKAVICQVLRWIRNLKTRLWKHY